MSLLVTSSIVVQALLIEVHIRDLCLIAVKDARNLFERGPLKTTLASIQILADKE
jgi:hypothetical protein